MPQPLTVLAQDLETGDLAADARGLRLATGADAVVVLVGNSLREVPGDNRMIPTRGIDWPDLLRKGASAVGIRTAIVRQVSGVSGVTRVASREVDAATPTMPCRLEIETAEGPASVTVGVGAAGG